MEHIEPTTGAAKKRRAGRACILCRTRKVRCDAVLCGAPCTNCRLDSSACTFVKNKRHRVSKASKSNAERSTSRENSVRETTFHHASQLHQVERETVPAATVIPNATNERTPRGVATDSQPSTTSLYPDLPAFIQPLPGPLDPVDLEYLQGKGALSIPSETFRNVCIERYLEFFHPLLPLLDKCQLLSILSPETWPDGSISLLLFNAVMCAGASMVEDSYIVEEGFASKKALRYAFFERTKILFDSNIEFDRFVAIQAAALLSTYYPGKRQKADTWFWAGIAVSLAHAIQLHIEPDSALFNEREIHLRRRLWWCTFSRDQKISLALGRPARSNYHTVRMLTPEDFEEATLAFTKPILQAGIGPTGVLDISENDDLMVRLCIEHMKFCVSIARCVETIFKCRQQAHSGSRNDHQGQSPDSPATQLDQCAQDFDRWYRELAPDLRYQADVATTSSVEIEHARGLIVGKATLHVVYHVANSALYRLKALSPTSTWSDSRGESSSSAQRVLRDTAWELTRTNQELLVSGLMPYASTTQVGSVVAAVIVHLLDVKAPSELVRRAAVRGIEQCRQYLLVLQNACLTAADALEFLRDAEKANIATRPPAQAQPPTTQAVQAHGTWPSTTMTTTSLGAVIPYSAAMELQSPPPTEMSPNQQTDEMIWQSWMEGAPTYDLSDPSLAFYDLPITPNDINIF